MAVGESLGKNTTLLGRRLRVRESKVAVDSRAEGRLLNRVLLVALGLGGCVDILFYRKNTGIGVLVFVALIVGALVVMARMERIRVVWRNVWLALPLFYFAGMVAIRANTELTLSNIAATGFLLLLFIYFFTENRVESLGLMGYPLTAARMLVVAIRRPTPMATRAVKQLATNPNHNKRAAEVIRGVLIALPILALFTLLLSSADSIFQGMVGDLFQLHFMTGAPETFLRIVIILLSSWGVAGLLLHTLRRQPSRSAVQAASGPATVPLVKRGISYVEGALVLVLVNGLFSVFAWVQFTVLFSGEAARTMGFEEYREYVRRGFGELLVVALLTMALIIGLRRAMRRATENQQRNLNLLNTAMIALAMVLLVSAFMRMVVWENIAFYINTPTRLYVRTFIVCLGALFAWLLLTTWFRRDRFAIGAFVAAIAFLVTVNLLNPDADVAAYNLRRNDELSVRYLYLLSDDAVPALVSGLDTTTGEVHRLLAVDLIGRMYDMKSDTQWQDWQSFNASRWDAYKAIMQAHDAGKLRPGNTGQAAWKGVLIAK
ncbi:MAG TPA: DUF4173 domain-containing protein [Chloroflexia bacterium]|nr:DUF4173 domain-containing protein [Chloroflexia bacterium]